jgi:hypothetical protein
VRWPAAGGGWRGAAGVVGPFGAGDGCAEAAETVAADIQGGAQTLRARLAEIDAELRLGALEKVGADYADRVAEFARLVGEIKAVLTDIRAMPLAATGEAMPNGAFPIWTAADIEMAVANWNVPGPHQTASAMKHIMRRATELGALDKVPNAWRADTQASDYSGKAAGPWWQWPMKKG